MIRNVSKFAFCTVGLLAAGAAFAQQNQHQQAGRIGMSQAQPQGQPAPGGVLPELKVRDLNRHPERFVGQPIAVTGEIEQIEGPNAFVLDGPGVFNDKILVVVERPRQQAGTVEQQPGTVGPVIREDQRVQLIGRLEELPLARIEEKYRPGLRSEIRAELEGPVPVLIVPPTGVRPVG